MAPGGPWAGPGRSGRSGDEQEAREAKRGVWQNRDAPAIIAITRALVAKSTCTERLNTPVSLEIVG